MISLGIIGISSTAAYILAKKYAEANRRPQKQKKQKSQNVITVGDLKKSKRLHKKPLKRGDSVYPTLKNVASNKKLLLDKSTNNREQIDVPVFEELNNCIIQKFRQDYRKFRIGESKGAMKTDAAMKRASSFIGDSSQSPLDEDKSTLFEFESTMDEQYKAVDKFRLDYRNYRCGNAFGAEGSITKLANELTSVQMKLLPVAQLQELRKFKDSRSRTMQKELHVHFGAGKLGLGLVVPAVLKSQCPVAIIQRPSGAWKPLLEEGEKKVDLKVNEEVVGSFDLLTDDSSAAVINEDSKLFLCSADPILMISLIKKARTFSMSLGRGIERLGRLLAEIIPEAPFDQRPALYACENDHKAVHDLEKTLEGKVDVHACMVDRICTTRDISQTTIQVGCEEYLGSIVVQMPPKWSPMPPFKGEAPLIPAIKAETNYLCRRKFMMVNGMHTTLAFMTLCMNEEGSTPGEHLLLNYATENKGVRARVWEWAVARLLMLVWEHDLEIIKDAHGVETDLEAAKILLDYARVTLRRFSGVSDTTTRVLSGGVANRWEKRLKPVDDFLQKTVKLDKFSKLLMKQAEVNLISMKSTVEDLCKDSRRFTGTQEKKTQKKDEKMVNGHKHSKLNK